MSLSTPLLRSIAAHQQQLVQLDAGTELRCVAGSLRVGLGHSGLVYSLSAGQSLRAPDDQWVSVSAPGAARFSLQADLAAQAEAQAQKNRQGLIGLWRSLAARLMVRRGPRAA